MALFSRTPIAPLEYSRTLWMRLWVGTVMVFTSLDSLGSM